MNTLAKKLLLKTLSTLKVGQITLHDQGQQYHFGVPGKLQANITINQPQFYSHALLKGSLGIAKGYIDGEWHCDDLYQLIRIIIQNEQAMTNLDSRLSKLPFFLLEILAKLRKNTIGRAKKHIHAHYDLGNDFFKTFLDETLLYSCAIFENPEDSLNQAQLNKIAKIVALLSPNANDHILEIGTGWGTLAIHLAQQYGCRVTTTTISEQQHLYVAERIRTLNLQDKITLVQEDYRNLQGHYDKIVSIEMLEAVGYQYFDTFFAQCNNLLKPGGLLMLQTITINEQNYETAKDHVDFIKKYVFPGGCLPSIARLSQSIALHSRFEWLNLNSIGPHYTTTLLKWYESFMQNIDQVRQLGFSEEFIRLWQYYFCYCAAGFQENYISDVQLLLRKRN